MTHERNAPLPSGPTSQSAGGEVQRLFFKTDRPRSIDQYIDYFGGADDAADAAENDPSGETVLERLA